MSTESDKKSLNSLIRTFKDFTGSTKGVGPIGSIGGPLTGTLTQGSLIAAPMLMYNLLRNRHKGYKTDWIDYAGPILAGLVGGGVLNAPEFLAKGLSKPAAFTKTAYYPSSIYRKNDGYIPVRRASALMASDPYLSYEQRREALRAIEGAGSGHVRPFDVAMSAAGAGAGMLAAAKYGNLLGNVFSSTTGKEQQALQGIGILAGAVTGAGLFNRRR